VRAALSARCCRCWSVCTAEKEDKGAWAGGREGGRQVVVVVVWRREGGAWKDSRWNDEGMETSNTIFTDAYALIQPAAGVPIRECLSYIYIVYCLLELITYIHTCTKLVNAGRVTVFRVRGQERLLREQKQALRASISRLAALSSQVSFGVASGG
jgi:hypothetical protein